MVDVCPPLPPVPAVENPQMTDGSVDCVVSALAEQLGIGSPMVFGENGGPARSAPDVGMATRVARWMLLAIVGRRGVAGSWPPLDLYFYFLLQVNIL